MTKKFAFRQLTEFNILDSSPSEGRIYELDFSQLRISDFFIRCPICGSKDIILRGKRKNRRKGLVQRYGCNSCTRRFTVGDRGHYPLWVVEAIFDKAMSSSNLNEVANQVKAEAKRHGYEIEISAQTVFNTIKRYVKRFLEFELGLKHNLAPKEWQIDDTPEVFPEDQKIFKNKEDKRKAKFVWITNILETDTRYWLVAHASPERKAEESQKAVTMALKRVKYAPLQFKCDGYKGHIRGIHWCVRHVGIDSKKKEEDFGHINLIESLHSFMRRKGIKKRGRFRSVENLQILVDLVRIYYNFLHRHYALGTTPAAKAGIAPSFRSWGEFIKYVYRHSK